MLIYYKIIYLKFKNKILNYDKGYINYIFNNA